MSSLAAILPFLTALAAVAMTWLYTFDCRFVEIRKASETGHGGAISTIGLWTAENFHEVDSTADTDAPGGMAALAGSCTTWRNHFSNDSLYIVDMNDFDAPFNFARIMSLILSFTTWILPVCLLLACCLSARFLKMIAVACFLSGFLSILCLIALTSEMCSTGDLCIVERDGVICIFASIIWIIAGLLTYSLSYRRNQYYRHSSHNKRKRQTILTSTGGEAAAIETKIHETVELDGSVTVTTTRSVLNPDGSLTVSETHEVRMPDDDDGLGHGGDYTSTTDEEEDTSDSESDDGQVRSQPRRRDRWSASVTHGGDDKDDDTPIMPKARLTIV